MLEKKSEQLLKYFVENCSDKYSILGKDEIISALPTKTKLDLETFDAIINFLREKEYLSVKYLDSAEICVMSTLKASAYFEEPHSTTREKVNLPNKQYLITFLSALLGALIGALIGGLIH
ncbi:MAG: hypothetical protein RR086_05590 [Clostridia bacterium]